MAEDVPAIQRSSPAAGAPDDRIITRWRFGDLGDKLCATSNRGHTRGCTTWTMKTKKPADLTDVSSLQPAPAGRGRRRLWRSSIALSRMVRSNGCEYPWEIHQAQYNLQEKFAKLHAAARILSSDPEGVGGGGM